MILEDGVANSRELVVHAAHGNSVCASNTCFVRSMDKIVNLCEDIISCDQFVRASLNKQCQRMKTSQPLVK